MGYAEKVERRSGSVTGGAQQMIVPPQLSRAAGSDWTIDGIQVGRLAKRLIKHRRERYALFDRTLFADPAWEILLALTVAECAQERLTVSKLCQRVDVPMTTTLRWIGIMTDAGLLVRRDDTTDKRRKFIELSSEALSNMIEYCSGSALNVPLAA
jgi:DNA-binding MarR family transcriptional regulator